MASTTSQNARSRDDTALESRLRGALARVPARIRRGPRWLVGFSGGADSTALLALLAARAAAGELPELLAVTIDHALRPEAPREIAHARRVAAQLGVPHVVARVACARPSETAARAARYEAFSRLARDHDARALVLAHHARDQRETLVLRMLRGTGPMGLCGMPERRPLPGVDCEVLRPLLALEPRALRAHLRAEGLPWVEDASNADVRWTLRNRVRHEILPALPAGALDALLREARAFRAAVAREVRASGPARPERLPVLRERSPWAREQIALDALAALDQRRPTRSLATRLAELLAHETRAGRALESRGHWRAKRHKDHVELRRLADAGGLHG